jgi:hypothetical protein
MLNETSFRAIPNNKTKGVEADEDKIKGKLSYLAYLYDPLTATPVAFFT